MHTRRIAQDTYELAFGGIEGEFSSEVTRLYPVTTPAIDQQLEDVVDTIRGFTTQVLAKSDFQHLLASPDEFSRLELPDYPTQAQRAGTSTRSPSTASGLHAGTYLAPDAVFRRPRRLVRLQR